MAGMTVSTAKMTAEQFLRLGADPPGVRLELVEGEIAVSPSPAPGHSFTEKKLSQLIANHIESRGLGALFGDVDTIINPFNVRRPDIIYFANEHLHYVGKQAMEGPPDLCVEIVSPSSEKIDRRDKFEQYRAFGVPHYWIVDYQRREAEGYVLRDGRYVETGRGAGDDLLRLPPFPDLDIPLRKLWWR